MSTNNTTKKESNSEVKKENQDLPNIPGSTEKINKEIPVKTQIKDSSELQDEGKTDNTEQNSK